MRLPLCIAGCGGYASSVLSRVHDMTDDFEFFFASRDGDKARAYSEEFGGSGYFGSYEEAAADPQVEALYFFTPHNLHLENALLAARHSKHVLMEKPIAPTVDESKTMIAATRDAGITLMVAENWRFLDTAIKAKELIANGAIGEVTQVHMVSERLAPSCGWRANLAERGGGVLIDGGIHYVDLLVNLGGLPRSVYAASSPHLSDNAEGEAAVSFVATLPGGGVATLTYSNATPIQSEAEEVRVTGTTGQLRFVPFGDNLTLATAEGETSVSVPTISAHGVRGMLTEFRSAVLEGREPVMSGEAGLADLVFVLGVYESMETGRPVELTSSGAS